MQKAFFAEYIKHPILTREKASNHYSNLTKPKVYLLK